MSHIAFKFDLTEVDVTSQTYADGEFTPQIHRFLQHVGTSESCSPLLRTSGSGGKDIVCLAYKGPCQGQKSYSAARAYL